MSYGIDLRESFRAAAGLVAKVLRGAKPADLPLSLPSTFELVLNVKAAGQLGLTFPSPLVMRANEMFLR